MSELKSTEVPATRSVFVEHKGMRSLLRVQRRFLPLKVLGAGANGVVCAAKDLCDNQLCCIKKLSGALKRKRLALRTLRELKVLRLLKGHPNVIQLKHVMSILDSQHSVYMVMEVMEGDLEQLIRSRQPLTEYHVQFFLYSLTKALKYTHSAGVVHRDLMPRNVLINLDCTLKLADFGLARFVDGVTDPAAYSHYVVSRWYRAPELLLRKKGTAYSTAIDIWGLGCILYELLARRPLLPGRNTFHQLQLIGELCGLSHKELHPAVYETQRKHIDTRTYTKNRLRKLLPGSNSHAVDLLTRMLAVDPKLRITATEVLNHPFLAPVHDPAEETSRALIPAHEFSFEHKQQTIDSLRSLMRAEISQHHVQDNKCYPQPTPSPFLQAKLPPNKGLTRSNPHRRRKSFS